jgi:hypothetical protein
LAWWHAGRLASALLYSDGRCTRQADASATDALELPDVLAPLLAKPLARPVRHAVLVTDETIECLELVRAELSLEILCMLRLDEALALGLANASNVEWLAAAALGASPVLCCLSPPRLLDAGGKSPTALSALLRQPWSNGSKLGQQLASSPEALAHLCGMLALAGYSSIVIRGSQTEREALEGFDWHRALAPFDAEPPAIGWSDADGKPCFPGAAKALELRMKSPSQIGLCTQIRAVYEQLTKTERRVADVVLNDPTQALESATARLAELSQVSQPQVIRFCRALGFEGVSAFKRALAGSLALGSLRR